MGKRSSNQVVVKSAKKAKADAQADPVITSIADVIIGAEDLPDRCRTMLVDGLPFSLKVPSDERHEIQTAMVDMVKQTLNSRKSSLEAAVSTEELKIASLQESQSKLASTVNEAEAALQTQKDAVHVAKSLLADATAAANASWKVLTDRRAEQKTSAAKLARAQEEKNALESAFEAHFKPLTEGASNEHFKGLEPHLKNIDIETSLLIALPSSCAKPKEQRGSFDTVVLTELEKALTAKIVALGEAVAVETPASAEHEAAAFAAQEEYDAKKDTQKRAATEFEAAQKEQSDRESTLNIAKKAVEEWQPQMNAAMGMMDSTKAALEAFELGPLAGFDKYSSMTSTPAEAAAAEAAPAGA